MTGGGSILLRNVELNGHTVDVCIAAGQVVDVGRRLKRPSMTEIDGRGGALLPGLHDHHIHLLALAAAGRSVDVGPRTVSGPEELRAVLRAADRALAPGSWIRAIGYHEAVAGLLDRDALDQIVRGRPVRVQHATGALWVLNSAAATTVGLDEADVTGVERDDSGRLTGRLFGLDDWLRDRLPADPPDLAPVGRRLARCGVTGVTDATPYRTPEELDHLRLAVEAGAVPQRVVVTGAPELDRTDLGRLVPGPAKVIVADHDPPSIEQLSREIRVARADHGRPVAFHCASRLGLVLALAALEEAGATAGSRIEHGAIVPPEVFARLVALGVTVVTQPAFVIERGDRYLAEVEPDDLPHLWRCATLVRAGIPVGFGSDAPHGPADPWVAIGAAAERRTENGHLLGPEDRLSPDAALDRFLTPPEAPGGPPRRIEPGARADLCLLSVPRAVAVAEPTADHVRLTIIDGHLIGC